MDRSLKFRIYKEEELYYPCSENKGKIRYKYLIVSLVFSHLGFWSGNLFLIAPFPDLCLLVPFSHDAAHLVYESRLVKDAFMQTKGKYHSLFFFSISISIYTCQISSKIIRLVYYKITFGFTMVVSVYKKGHNAEFNGKTTKAVHS